MTQCASSQRNRSMPCFPHWDPFTSRWLSFWPCIAGSTLWLNAPPKIWRPAWWRSVKRTPTSSPWGFTARTNKTIVLLLRLEVVARAHWLPSCSGSPERRKLPRRWEWWWACSSSAGCPSSWLCPLVIFLATNTQLNRYFCLITHLTKNVWLHGLTFEAREKRHFKSLAGVSFLKVDHLSVDSTFRALQPRLS